MSLIIGRFFKLIIHIVLLVMYMPVGVFGYLTYGDSLRDSIINSLQTQWIQSSVNMLITVHCLLTLTIVFNPLNQEVEELFRVPQRNFSLSRIFFYNPNFFRILLSTRFRPNSDDVPGGVCCRNVAVFWTVG